MAKGKKCSQCGTPMYAIEEEDLPAGRYVTYACPSCKSKEKIFEDYADK